MALAQDRRGQAIEVPVISVELIRASNLGDLSQDLDSDLLDLSQYLDCGELVKLAGEPQISAPLGLHDGAA